MAAETFKRNEERSGEGRQELAIDRRGQGAEGSGCRGAGGRQSNPTLAPLKPLVLHADFTLSCVDSSR